MEKNHGKKFWRIVSSIIPDFKERERWLKKNGYLLRL
jgi:predicted metal-dependent hydrolase